MTPKTTPVSVFVPEDIDWSRGMNDDDPKWKKPKGRAKTRMKRRQKRHT